MFLNQILRRVFLPALLIVLSTHRGFADFDSGSDGSDGAFNPQFKSIIDLSLAATGIWDDPSPVPGQGIYDAEKWAVVFKYTTINVPAGVTVSFTNHPSGAPVVWLASGDVTIAGTVKLDGADGAGSSLPMSYAEPGPGGFAGGVRSSGGSQSSNGFGPGGGTGGGSYGGGANSYGNVRILPLIGGSGGAANSSGGGAGGGAILIASSGQITLALGGAISAVGGEAQYNGGYGYGGSGGAIRLIADMISGDGVLRAPGGYGSNGYGNDGRIRVDADIIQLTDLGTPAWTTDFAAFPVWPAANGPSLGVVSINGQPVPTDPGGGIPSTEVEIDSGGPIVVGIQAKNIPSGTAVTVRVTPARGSAFTVTSTPLAVGPGGILTATANATFPAGKSEIQLKANWTP